MDAVLTLERAPGVILMPTSNVEPLLPSKGIGTKREPLSGERIDRNGR